MNATVYVFAFCNLDSDISFNSVFQTLNHMVPLTRDSHGPLPRTVSFHAVQKNGQQFNHHNLSRYPSEKNGEVHSSEYNQDAASGAKRAPRYCL